MKIGIDFGTSFSSAAVYIDNEIHRIYFDGVELQFPSIAFFPDPPLDLSRFRLTEAEERQINTEISSETFQFNKKTEVYKKEYRERDNKIKELNSKRDEIENSSLAKSKKQKELDRIDKAIDNIVHITEPKQRSGDEIRKSMTEAFKRHWIEQQRKSLGEEALDVHKVKGVFGTAALEKIYLGEYGKIFQSPKSMLGHRLDSRQKDLVVGVISQMLSYIRTSACQQLPVNDITDIVLGRPVIFRGNNSENDMEVQQLLKRAAQEAGFKSIEFMQEPVAAAFALHHTLSETQFALIIDIGGGTTDIAYAQVGGDIAKPVIDRNCVWGRGFGGSDIDTELSVKTAMPLFGMNEPNSPTPPIYRAAAKVDNLAEQKRFRDADINRVSEPFKSRLMSLKEEGATLRLSRIVESMKIAKYNLGKTIVKNVDFSGQEFEISVTPEDVDSSEKSFIRKFNALLNEVFEKLPKDRPQPLIFMTGGTSLAPCVKECVCKVFKESKIIISDNASLDVVTGLALFANMQLFEMELRGDANDGVDSNEILWRNQRIQDALISIEALERRYSINLYYESQKWSMTPGSPANCFGDGDKKIYGNKWLDERLDYIHQQIIPILAKNVMDKAKSYGSNDEIFTGGARAIATRLSLYCYGHLDRYYVNHNIDCHDFNRDASGLGISLNDVIDEVYESFTKPNMRYRLWTDDVLKCLNDYLYDDDFDHDNYISLSDLKHPKTLDQFLDAVDEAINDMPINEAPNGIYYERNFRGALFSEYVPAQCMTNEQKEWLYTRYLELFVEQNSIDTLLSNSNKLMAVLAHKIPVDRFDVFFRKAIESSYVDGAKRGAAEILNDFMKLDILPSNFKELKKDLREIIWEHPEIEETRKRREMYFEDDIKNPLQHYFLRWDMSETPIKISYEDILDCLSGLTRPVKHSSKPQ